MFDQIQNIKNELDAFKSSNSNEIEKLRIDLLGKKGKITALFQLFREVPASDKKEFGKQLNLLKVDAQEKINSLKSNSEADITKKSIDLTISAQPTNIGSRHPITIIRDQITNIFSQIGFSVSEGPEIEDDWHNFSALNFPEEHPARDMQDTFFINKDLALRTHTSSVQVRVMENSKPPIRTISPGRVYRNEAISARAHCFFSSS
jgi:phenylalanyl-tRNA synthetase alpha chain